MPAIALISVIQLMEHRQGAQLREGGQVKAVVAFHNFKHTGSLSAGEAEEVHRGEVHAHQRSYAASLLRHEIVIVGWGSGAKGRGPEVEVFPVVVEVGKESEEA